MKVRYMTATHLKWERSRQIMAQRVWAKSPKPTKEQIQRAVMVDYAQKMALLRSELGTAQ